LTWDKIYPKVFLDVDKRLQKVPYLRKQRKKWLCELVFKKLKLSDASWRSQIDAGER